MEEDPESELKKVFVPGNVAIKLTKWKVKKGTHVTKGVVLALYEALNPDSTQKSQKLKSSDGGIVHKIEVAEGEEATPGSLLLTLGTKVEEPCSHPTVMKDMCALCGADLRSELGLAGDRKENVSASVAMVHSIPELIISEQQALELGQEDENRLLKNRKLVLLVDLDQTLIHTTNDNIPPKLKDVSHFQLWHGPNLLWYHTRFRPNTRAFLKKIAQMYELHICTFGVRMYAHTIARLLDPEGKFFSHRILSRDECFNAISKTANLKALFPCGDSMVCIIDDREDVWNFSPNLIHVKPYRFFQGTADINAPPGLTKTENDNIPVTHRVRRASDSQDDKTDIKQNDKADAKQNNNEDTKPNDKADGKQHENADVKPNDKADAKQNDKADDKPNDKADSKQNESEDAKPNDKADAKQNDKKEGNIGEADKVMNEPVDKQTGKADAKQSEDKSVESQDVEMADESKKAEIPQVNGTDGVENSKPNEQTDLNHVTKDSSDMETKSASENSSKMDIDEPSTDETKDTKNTKDGKTESVVPKDEAVKECSESPEATEKDEEDEVEWEDEDDYLYHLEEILTRIHKAFYELYDQTKSKSESKLPNLKDIIPYVKRKVLKGCNIVFSGVVPLNMQPDKSRAYVVARALGATIQSSIIPRKGDNKTEATTHLIAAKPGTAKVNTAQKTKGVSIVSTNWLWVCAERWERVDERLFPLEDQGGSKSGPWGQKVEKQPDTSSVSKRKSDEMMDSESPDKDNVKNVSKKAKLKDEDDDVFGEGTSSQPVAGPSGTRGDKNAPFASSYNPLYSFSDADIQFMDKEVDELMDEESDDSEAENDIDRNERIRQSVLGDVSDSSSIESLAGDFPRGWNIRKKSPKAEEEKEEVKEEGEESDTEVENFEKTVKAFSPDNSQSSESNDSVGSVDDEIAEAVEKEFLSLL